MKQYNASYLRKNLSKAFDSCEDSNQPVLITTKKSGRDEPQQIVIISKLKYDSLSGNCK